jgi:hypothetical protein
MTITHQHTGDLKTIDKKYPNQAHMASGWMMTTDGKSTAQFKRFSGAILKSCMQ